MSTCPTCERSDPTGGRFCSGCGAALTPGVVPAPVPPGTLFGGQYEVRDEIGRGGMAYVFSGWDRRLGREVAIKVLPESRADDDRLVRRFHDEARVMAALDHPNLVPVYASGTHGRFHYIVMKRLAGRTLHEVMPLAPSRVRHVLTEVCRAVEHVHERGLVHRDIKPSNVMLGTDGRVTLMDFGLARWAGDERRLTRAGSVFGTAEYMAPEQASGRVVATTSTDIYALGVLAYELLCGSPPFVAESAVAVGMMHVQNLPPPLRPRVAELDPGLEDVVFRCLAKSPRKRFPSVQALRAALGGADRDRRLGDRVPINAAFATRVDLFREFASDVSRTGCFLRTDADLPIGTEVKLRFTVLDSDLDVVCGQGEVVRGDERGVGIRFTELSDASRRCIERVLHT